MPNVTDTQSLRYGYVSDPMDWTMLRNLADDIAAQLDLADVARTKALKRPQAQAQRNAALALAVNAATVVPFDTEVWDTHAMVDIAGQPTRITAGATAGAGLYLFLVRAICDTTGWTKAEISLNKNGVSMAQRTYHTPQGFSPLYFSQVVYLGTVGDFVTLSVFHEGGAATTNTSEVNLQAWKISD